MRIVDPSVRRLLTRLVDGQTQVLGADLVGAYVFGSVVTGDFEPGISDVDTVGVVRSDLTAAQLAGLERLHRDIVEEMPGWEDRVEAVYLWSRALKTFRTGSSAAARISPGEPFHAIEVDHRWLIDWYQLREVGIALYGPPAASLVPVISHDEYVERCVSTCWPGPIGSTGSRHEALRPTPSSPCAGGSGPGERGSMYRNERRHGGHATCCRSTPTSSGMPWCGESDPASDRRAMALRLAMSPGDS
jgi:hypothetical protein